VRQVRVNANLCNIDAARRQPPGSCSLGRAIRHTVRCVLAIKKPYLYGGIATSAAMSLCRQGSQPRVEMGLEIKSERTRKSYGNATKLLGSD